LSPSGDWTSRGLEFAGGSAGGKTPRPAFADTFDVRKAKDRTEFIKQLVERVPAAKDQNIDGELLKIIDAMAGQREPAPTPSATDAASLLAEMPADLRAEAETMLVDRLLIKCIVDDVAALNIAGEKELTAKIYLVGTSRLLPRPLSTIVQGPTASGKSYLPEKTASLFPPEAVIHAKQMTPQALFHMRPGSLSHRFILAGERSCISNDEQSEANRALREMLSAGKLSKLMPMKSRAAASSRC
jgi:hypothetical protein